MKNLVQIIIIASLVTEIVINPVIIKGNTYYYEFNGQGEGKLVSDEIEFETMGNAQDNIQHILECLFNNEEKFYSFIPEGVTITNILYINGELDVEVSEDILNYGGTAREISMVDQILATVFSYDEVNTFTLYIEEEREYLVEGMSINKYTRDKWKERIELIGKN